MPNAEDREDFLLWAQHLDALNRTQDRIERAMADLNAIIDRMERLSTAKSGSQSRTRSEAP